MFMTSEVKKLLHFDDYFTANTVHTENLSYVVNWKTPV